MDVRVEFLVPWNCYRAGQVIDPPDGQANVMIQRGIVKPVEEEESERAQPKRERKRKDR